MNSNNTPKDGLQGLKENFISDFLSGFIVFLLALPLSLGIAKASDFPPITGLITAIIGGTVVSLFSGSKLTIKGPAAGLIVIVAGSVAEFGGGDIGWRLTLGAIIIAGLLQVVFGLLKLGKLSDFFPLSAIRGMLAAIGLIIIAKQIPVLLNVDPSISKGKGPIELLASVPQFVMHLDTKGSVIGLLSLMTMLLWPLIPNKSIQKVPAPLIVLLLTIPLGFIFEFAKAGPAYSLVHIGNILNTVGWNVDFSGVYQPAVFVKYVVMFALVGSLESLLTVKAIDMLDPYKRKSNTNQDLLAVGFGNMVSGMLGGLPMISEVARSSSNVNNGAKTRWANFFHGFFILVFVLLFVPVIEMIPNAALAGMLIAVGIKLAHPQEFIHVYKIGREQLAIFLTTIFFTLFEDLLVGIAAGILLKMLFHLSRGVSLRSFFTPTIRIALTNDEYDVTIQDAALFTNWISIKNKLLSIPKSKHIKIDVSGASMLDHSVIYNLHLFEQEYQQAGGQFTIKGLEHLRPVSDHAMACRVKRK